jgi:hypothetical protein
MPAVARLTLSSRAAETNRALIDEHRAHGVDGDFALRADVRALRWFLAAVSILRPTPQLLLRASTLPIAAAMPYVQAIAPEYDDPERPPDQSPAIKTARRDGHIIRLPPPRGHGKEISAPRRLNSHYSKTRNGWILVASQGRSTISATTDYPMPLNRSTISDRSILRDRSRSWCARIDHRSSEDLRRSGNDDAGGCRECLVVAE